MMTLPTWRQYLIACLGFIGAVVVSWLAYLSQTAEQIVTGLVGLAVVVVAWKRPSWLALISVGELVIGSKGYLLFLQVGDTKLSLRMILFVVLMVAALPRLIRSWPTLRTSVLTTAFLAWCGWLLVSVTVGFVRHTPLVQVFADANGFLYLAALPAWWLFLRTDHAWRQKVLALLLASGTVIGIESWLVLLLFGQDFTGIRHVYEWVRNTGLGEVTYIHDRVYRVFFQSQLYAVLALTVTFGTWITGQARRWWLVPMTASALAVLISLSRSFWLGLAAVMGVSLVVWAARRSWTRLRRALILMPVALVAWIMMTWALSWPYFTIGDRTDLVASRFQASTSADAATARQNQFRPLLIAVTRHPVLGSGLGTAVTYFSTDPRVRGWRTTAAFELGYLDLWLKIGLVGLLVYGAWLWKLWRRLRPTVWYPALASGTVALLVIHIASPYLNHPLGLGWLMIVSLFAYDPA